MKIAVLLMAMITCSIANAFDYYECTYKIEKLKKEARNADDTASSASGQDAISQIHNALADVDTALSKAKSACAYELLAKNKCKSIASFAAINGVKAAEMLCYTATGGDLKQCLSCVGSYK